MWSASPSFRRRRQQDRSPSAAAVGTAPSHSKQMNRCCLIFLLPIALRLIIASRSEARKGFTWRGRVYLQWKRWTLLTVVYAYKIKLLSSTFWASENIRYLEQSTGRKRREIEHCEVEVLALYKVPDELDVMVNVKELKQHIILRRRGKTSQQNVVW